MWGCFSDSKTSWLNLPTWNELRKILRGCFSPVLTCQYSVMSIDVTHILSSVNTCHIICQMITFWQEHQHEHHRQKTNGITISGRRWRKSEDRKCWWKSGLCSDRQGWYDGGLGDDSEAVAEHGGDCDARTTRLNQHTIWWYCSMDTGDMIR